MTQTTTSTLWSVQYPIDLPAMADENAVAMFAQVMRAKMEVSRAKGRGGWQTCSIDVLWTMLREHVEKGDPVDVACLAMMIHHNREAAQ